MRKAQEKLENVLNWMKVNTNQSLWDTAKLMLKKKVYGSKCSY